MARLGCLGVVGGFGWCLLVFEGLFCLRGLVVLVCVFDFSFCLQGGFGLFTFCCFVICASLVVLVDCGVWVNVRQNFC